MISMKKDEGVSELVGALTLMAVLVIAAAIILSGLVSVYPQEQLPDPRIDIYNIKDGISDNTIYILSLGGDPLHEGEYLIKVHTHSGDYLDITGEIIPVDTSVMDKMNIRTGNLLYYPDSADDISIIDVIYKDPGTGAETLMFRKDLVAAGSSGSCSVTPSYTIDYDPVSQISPVDVTLTDTSRSRGGTINSWTWTLVGAVISSSPTHVLSGLTPGRYFVTLSVGNECGASRSTTRRIDVYGCVSDPTAVITTIPHPPLQVGGDTFRVRFTGHDSSSTNGATITDYEWDFGEGSTGDTAGPYTIEYGPGDHTVTLTVIDSCFNSKDTSVLVSLEGDTSCSISPVIEADPGLRGAVPYTVKFDDGSTSIGGSINEWEWNFGEGTPGDTSGPYTITYREPGTYLVTLTLKNVCGAEVQTFEEVVVTDISCTRVISASSGDNGSISPEGDIEVNCGDDQSFVITAEPCYSIASVDVDGSSIIGTFESPYTYPFTDIQSDHTIHASFSPTAYTITASAGTGGRISPEGEISVECGDDQTFTITPDDCYTIQDVLVDGVSVGPVSTYPFENVLADHTIEALFSINTFTITATAGDGGSISPSSPSGSVPVNCGSEPTFTITPDTGYAILDVRVNGVSVGPVNQYTFPPVEQDGQTIHATFISTSTCWTISGYITNDNTGDPISGVRVYAYNQGDRTTIIGTAISQANGFYILLLPVPTPERNRFYDINCPDTAQWTTVAPESKWQLGQQINPSQPVNCNLKNINFRLVPRSTFFDTVFVYGNNLIFAGSTINGPGAAVIIKNGLDTSHTNLGAAISASTIYLGNHVNLDSGSAGLGSSTHPGNIYVDGNLRLWTGARNIYGDVYVNGNFDLKDARIHGTVHAKGDLTLGWTPWLADDARIYYTGDLYTPPNFDRPDILAKCIFQTTVPDIERPEGMPSLKPASWYTEKGYSSSGELTSNMKIFANSYSSTGWKPTAENVIIVARTGDITITGIGGSGVSGLFFAPNGRVTFGGAFLNGMVISRDGLHVVSGGTHVTFQPVSNYIGDPGDYPFQNI